MAVVERVCASILLLGKFLRLSQALLGHFNFSEETLWLITAWGRLTHDFDLLELSVTEDSHAFWSISEPWMLEHLVDWGPLLRVFQEQFFNQMTCRFWELVFDLWWVSQRLVHYRVSQLCNTPPFKRHHATKHSKQTDAKTPDIGLLATERLLALEDFRRHIGRCTALVFDSIIGVG